MSSRQMFGNLICFNFQTKGMRACGYLLQIEPFYWSISVVPRVVVYHVYLCIVLTVSSTAQLIPVLLFVSGDGQREQGQRQAYVYEKQRLSTFFPLGAH